MIFYMFPTIILIFENINLQFIRILMTPLLLQKVQNHTEYPFNHQSYPKTLKDA
jgi:hypothetical protein